MSLKAWNEAKKALSDARDYIGKIGKPQRTTVDAVGKLHQVSVKTMVYFQETDGAKNYHECSEFDKALSGVVLRLWPALQAEVIEELERRC